MGGIHMGCPRPPHPHFMPLWVGPGSDQHVCGRHMWLPPVVFCRKPWWGRLPLIYPSECHLSSASEVKTVFVLFCRASSNPPTTIWPSRQWCKLHLVFVYLTKSAYLKSAFVAAVFPKNKKVLSYISTRLTNESIVKWRWIWKTWSILTE